jgi:hypothetical protein
MRKVFLLIGCLLTGSILFAQQFGGYPPSTQWKQINTDTVRVVFPAGLGLEKQAADVANTAQRLGRQTSGTIGDRIRKISIVLHPYTTISNGYVGLGPWRSEFHLIPAQSSFDLGSLPWYHQLALHEYRHVQQYNNFRKGISRAMYYLFGQEGLALANSAAVPNWFWEGDAVWQETHMSKQGRGRLPFFFNDYRSLWVADKKYSWMKLRNGSLRDFVPDHYRLGYMMMAYGYKNYGNEFWKKVTNDAVRFKGLFYPLQHAVEKFSQTPYASFRKNAMNYFEVNAEQNKKDSVSNWAKQQKHFAGDEEFPQWISDDEIVFVKSSYRSIPVFYIRNIRTGTTRRLRTKDISLDNYFSYCNGKIVYAAYEPDVRWAWKDYSVLKVLDLETGSQQTITRHSNYFAPDIGNDGRSVVAVYVQPGGQTELRVVDAQTSMLIKKIPNPDHFYYTQPKFYGDHSVVSAVRNTKGEMTLAMIDIQNGSVETLLPWSLHVIGFPAVHGDTITFTTSHNEQDALFALVNNKLYQLNTNGINSGTGNYQFSTRNGKAIYSAFTAAGYHLVQQNITTANWQPVDRDVFTAPAFTYGLSEVLQATPVPVDTTAPAPVTRYPKSFHLINFHSWRPFISDPDYTFSLVGENVLNTLQTEIYFNYNTNEKFKDVGATAIYGGWFPYISLGVSETFDRKQADSPVTRTWNELNARLGLQLPFTFTSGRYYRRLSISGGINTHQVNYTGLSKSGHANQQFYFADGSVSFTMQSQTARQHIYPRFGNSFIARYRAIVNKYSAYQLLLNEALYLPGLAQTHNLVLTAAYHARDTVGQYYFSNSFPFSRGYPNYNFPRMWKLGANYHFPLVYPDWGFGNIVYFLRLRANAFYDYTDAQSLRTKLHYQFRTAGGELFFDTKWWNEYPVSVGIRYSRLLDSELTGLAPNQWEIILPVNLLGR